MSLLISPMNEQNITEVVELSAQLGYPVTLENMTRNFRMLRATSNQEVFVAHAEKTVGWIHVYEHLSIATGVRCEIGGLVVDEASRGKGIGAELMSKAENWAQSRGILEISFSSRITRVDAHRFYERLGYRIQKTSHIFNKRLSS